MILKTAYTAVYKRSVHQYRSGKLSIQDQRIGIKLLIVLLAVVLVLSLLLCVVMVLGLVPTAAFAAGTRSQKSKLSFWKHYLIY